MDEYLPTADGIVLHPSTDADILSVPLSSLYCCDGTDEYLRQLM